jgi:hypothetical protein
MKACSQMYVRVLVQQALLGCSTGHARVFAMPDRWTSLYRDLRARALLICQPYNCEEEIVGKDSTNLWSLQVRLC